MSLVSLRRYPVIRQAGTHRFREDPTSVIAKILSATEIPITGLAAAVVKLELFGSERISKASPAVIDVPSKDGSPAGKFTLVNNPGLLRLAGLKAK